MSLKSGWLGALGVAGLVMAATVSAPAVAPAAAADEAAPLKCASNPLIGTWRLNLKKSTITRPVEMNGGEAKMPGRMTFIAPWGKDGISYVFIGDDDKRISGREETWMVQFDGKPYPTEGGDPRLLSWKRIDCNTFEMTTWRQLVMNKDGTVKEYYPEGQAQSHSRIVAAPDGKTFTTTHSGQLGSGAVYENEILVYDRL